MRVNCPYSRCRLNDSFANLVRPLAESKMFIIVAVYGNKLRDLWKITSSVSTKENYKTQRFFQKRYRTNRKG